jgi:lactobin A/cerein 7B family class IIb bacteriocin
MKNLSLTELSFEEMQSVDGGCWICKVVDAIAGAIKALIHK